MIVVGVGCGPGMLTKEAVKAIEAATMIFGSERSILLAKPHIGKECRIEVIRDYGNLERLPKDSVVLSTGDPMLAGLGHLGDEVIPGVSSMQLAFARLKLPLEKGLVISVHSKGKEDVTKEVAEEITKGRAVFLLADPMFDITRFASGLTAQGVSCKIIVCENLGYENESIGFGDNLRPPAISSELFSLIVTQVQR
ncbi:MAG TPA: cobalt-precorrin-7 (C(5))-methyltransferase [Methanomassiliicoccales archaeon]|jgi:cobalt-precorrin-7 (C5)-methyltransferase